MKICLKWVHTARYGLILRLEGALWLTIIFKPLLIPKGAIKIGKILILLAPAIHTGWGNRKFVHAPLFECLSDLLQQDAALLDAASECVVVSW